MTTASRLARLERNTPRFPNGGCGGKADVFFHNNQIPTDLPRCPRCGEPQVFIVQIEEVVVDVTDVHCVERTIAI